MSHAARASGKFPGLPYWETETKDSSQEVNMTEQAKLHRTPLHHRQIIKVFRHTIEETLIPSQILSYLRAALPSLTRGGEIWITERRTCPREAAHLLIDKLLDCKEPGWFQAFIDALKHEGYVALVSLLDGTSDTTEANEVSRALLDVFAPALQNVKPSEILPHLVSSGCLGEADEQVIRQREETEGPISACHLLLDRIPRKAEEWFSHFIAALHKNGYRGLADDIEPAFHKTLDLEGADNFSEKAIQVGKEKDAGTKQDSYLYPTEETRDDTVINEHHIQYDSIGKDSSADLLAGNDHRGPEVETADMTGAHVDVSREGSLTPIQAGTEAPSLVCHTNIPMTDNVNLLGTEVKESAESEVDNTQMPGGESARLAPLELRDYQMELAESSVEGKNTIVSAPTGSGKTHVALYIATRHLDAASLEEDRKVVFIVPTVYLVTQQKAMFEKYLPYKTMAVSGDASSSQVSLAQHVPNNDIFVLTAQILVDALTANEARIEMSTFSLLIFDECHHADKGHPYNKVMALYLDKKLVQGSILPQIVGLTASVGVGKAKDRLEAQKHILRLCANLDAEKLCTVQRHRQQLMLHTPRPSEAATKEVPGRRIDPFKDILCQLVKMIEQRLCTDVANHGHLLGDLLEKLVAPSEPGSARYTLWVNSLTCPIAKIRDSNMKQLVFACVRHLKMYNEALLINAHCQSTDALNYILADLGKLKWSCPNETEVWLERIFKDQEETLHGVSRDVRYDNPKLEQLREVILDFYEKDADSRGIIFCGPRAMAVALERWMRETGNLRWLNPKRLVAANAPTDKGGMMQSEQEDVLRYFRDGTHKIIIATSVAEEGLDIQACNFVIRYEHVTNETAHIQSRGRARKKGAEYLLVTEEGSGMMARDEMNKIRVDMMNDAIRAIDNMTSDDFHRRVSEYQEEARQDREIDLIGARALAEWRRARPTGGNYNLLCMKCDAFVCISSEIHRIEKCSHVVLTDDFKELALVKKHHRPRDYDGFNMMGKLHCVKCGHDWGVVARYKNIHFPVLKAAMFSFEDENGRREIHKKWKDVPFTVSALTTESLQLIVTRGDDLVTLDF